MLSPHWGTVSGAWGVAKCWRRPGEKTSKQQLHTAMSRSGPAARAQGSHCDCPATPQGVSGVGWGVCRTEDRVLQAAPGTNRSVPEWPHSALSSAQATRVTQVCALRVTGRWAGVSRRYHQEIVTGNSSWETKKKQRWPEWRNKRRN